MTKRKIEYWVIPPDADGEFVAHMEKVLNSYEKAYDPRTFCELPFSFLTTSKQT